VLVRLPLMEEAVSSCWSTWFGGKGRQCQRTAYIARWKVIPSRN